MSRILKISVIRPGKPPYNTDGTAITIPSYDGYLGILYDRQPLLSLMKAGLITITNTNGKKTFFAVSGGFAEVENNVITLLCDSIVTSNDISENNSQETSESKDVSPKLFLKDASLMNESEKFKYLVEMLRRRLRQEEQKTSNQSLN